MNSKTPNKPVIVTGLSGAGLSSILKSLEDLGFEVFDNFPLDMVEELALRTENKAALAISIDSRTRGFSTDNLIEKARAIDAQLVFITCDNDILLQRFTETRRRHPQTGEGETLRTGIEKERTLLQSLTAKADLNIDSSALSIHDLRHILEGHFGARTQNALSINLLSFGFRHGLPREADIVMDVRFLKNPHWNETLKPKTGLDKDVGTYIEEDEDFESFMQNLQSLITPLIPRYTHEGKHYLTIAIGCTGGRHRSVYCIEKLEKWFESQKIPAQITHRDLKN